MEIIGWIVGLFLALYGAAELIARLWYRVLFGGDREPIYIVIDNTADAEHRIRRFAAWCRCSPMSSYQPTVVLRDTRSPLARVCDELRLRVVSQKEWDEMSKSALQVPEHTL